jgi:hypothetical protein
LNLLWIVCGVRPRAARPELEVAAVLQLPLRRGVVEKVEDAVAFALHVVRVVDVRMEVVPGTHQADAAA